MPVDKASDKDARNNSGTGLHLHSPALTLDRLKSRHKAIEVSKENEFLRLTPDADSVEAPQRRQRIPTSRPKSATLYASPSPTPFGWAGRKHDKNTNITNIYTKTSMTSTKQRTILHPLPQRTFTTASKPRFYESGSTRSSQSAKTTDSDSRELDPFAPRPRIPRGEPTWEVSVEQAGPWGELSSPIRLRRRQGLESDSSSEGFDFGVWESPSRQVERKSLPETPSKGKTKSEAEDVVEGVERGRRRSENLETLLGKNRVNGNVSSETLTSFPLFESRSRQRKNPFTHFSSVVPQHDPGVRSISGSLLSTHFAAYSPPMVTKPNEPRKKDRETTFPASSSSQQRRPRENEGNIRTSNGPQQYELRDGKTKTVRTTFHVQAGSQWGLYIDGVQFVGSGDVDVEIDVPYQPAVSASLGQRNTSQTSGLRNPSTHDFEVQGTKQPNAPSGAQIAREVQFVSKRGVFFRRMGTLFGKLFGHDKTRGGE